MLLIIPTFNAGELWPRVMESVLTQNLHHLRVCVIDSGSQDWTLELARKAGWEIEDIPNHEFNHGGTRQKALKFLRAEDQFVIYMTQDAILHDSQSLSNLIQPFEDPRVALVYGRQLPHENATALSAQARSFNYPSHSFEKTYSDRTHLGIKTPFCSNSLAAYRLSALKAVGGFDTRTIMGEDMLMAAKLLKLDHKLFYQSKACAYHSHNYTLIQEFKRYFDTGVFHHESRDILGDFGGVGGEGLKLLKAQLNLAKEGPITTQLSLIAEIVVRNSMKYLAYQLGVHHPWIPLRIKRNLSFFSNYWQRDH